MDVLNKYIIFRRSNLCSFKSFAEAMDCVHIMEYGDYQSLYVVQSKKHEDSCNLPLDWFYVIEPREIIAFESLDIVKACLKDAVGSGLSVARVVAITTRPPFDIDITDDLANEC